MTHICDSYLRNPKAKLELIREEQVEVGNLTRYPSLAVSNILRAWVLRRLLRVRLIERQSISLLSKNFSQRMTSETLRRSPGTTRQRQRLLSQHWKDAGK